MKYFAAIAILGVVGQGIKLAQEEEPEWALDFKDWAEHHNKEEADKFFRRAVDEKYITREDATVAKDVLRVLREQAPKAAQVKHWSDSEDSSDTSDESSDSEFSSESEDSELEGLGDHHHHEGEHPPHKEGEKPRPEGERPPHKEGEQPRPEGERPPHKEGEKPRPEGEQGTKAAQIKQKSAEHDGEHPPHDGEEGEERPPRDGNSTQASGEQRPRREEKGGRKGDQGTKAAQIKHESNEVHDVKRLIEDVAHMILGVQRCFDEEIPAAECNHGPDGISA